MSGRRLLAVLILLAVSAGSLGAEDSVAPAAFKGTFACGVTLYMLPSTRDGTPMVTGQGEMEITADGNGKLVAGRLTERIADDTHHPSGADVCSFALVSGTYSINQDGSGTSSARWALGANDTAHCTNFVPGSKFNGIDTGRQSAPPASSNSTLFFDGKNRSYSVGVVDRGFAVAVCDRSDASQ
jgi:hypothetical protein